MAYRHVKAWRKRLKALLVQSFGGQCCGCDYHQCLEALEFHHIKPGEKDLHISAWTAVASFRRLSEEARKCVMLCANCHREVHAGVRSVPSDARMFDPTLFEVKRKEAALEKRAAANVERTRTAQKRVSWDGVDVVVLRHGGASWESIARIAHVTGAAVRKRHRKLTGQ